METITRARNYSVSAAAKTLEAASNVLDKDPLPSMWVASGTAIAHAPNVTELEEEETEGPNIEFIGGRSVRTATFQSLREKGRANSRLAALSESAEPDHATPHSRAHRYKPKVPWYVAAKHGCIAFWRFFSHPTGFIITIYGLNIVAWGGEYPNTYGELQQANHKSSYAFLLNTQGSACNESSRWW